MKSLIVCLLMALVFLPAFSDAQLPTDVDKFSLAAGFDKVLNDSGWNVLGAVPYKVGPFDGYAAGILQSGNVIRGKYHAEVSIPVGGFSLTPFVFGTSKGYELNSLAHDTNYGAGIDTPDISGLSIRIGIFGKNAGAWGAVNAQDVLEDNGFNPDDLEGLNLQNVTVPPTGIPNKIGNTVNALIETQFAYKGVSFGVKGLPEISGSDNPAHQMIVSAHVSKSIGDHVELSLGIEKGFQWWNDVVDTENAYFLGLGIVY